jgi:hypothetical protein
MKTPGSNKEGPAEKKKLRTMGLKQKIPVLAMFLVRETAKRDCVEDLVASINGLNSDFDGVHRRVFVYFKFRNEARASPQIWNMAP